MRARHVVAFLVVFLVGAAATPVAGAVLDALECNGCVDTKDLGGGAVTSTKIKDSAVKTADLANKAVTRAKIKNRTVNQAKLAVDVLMSARVLDDGTFVTGTPGTTSQRGSAGNYTVTFPTNVAGCVATASPTPGFFDGPDETTVVPSIFGGGSIIVWALNDDLFVDTPFSVIVACP